MNKNEKGFGAVEILVLVVIVGLLGAAGWLVHNRLKNKVTVQTQTPIKDNQSSESKTVEPTKNSNTNSSDPVTRLEKLYKDYLTDTPSYKGDSGLTKFKNSGYISHGYTSENNSGEPLVCGQEAYPNKITVKLISKSSEKAVLTGTKVYSDGSIASESIQAEMSLNESNEWQLQKTICVPKS